MYRAAVAYGRGLGSFMRLSDTRDLTSCKCLVLLSCAAKQLVRQDSQDKKPHTVTQSLSAAPNSSISPSGARWPDQPESDGCTYSGPRAATASLMRRSAGALNHIVRCVARPLLNSRCVAALTSHNQLGDLEPKLNKMMLSWYKTVRITSIKMR